MQKINLIFFGLVIFLFVGCGGGSKQTPDSSIPVMFDIPLGIYSSGNEDPFEFYHLNFIGQNKVEYWVIKFFLNLDSGYYEHKTFIYDCLLLEKRKIKCLASNEFDSQGTFISKSNYNYEADLEFFTSLDLNRIRIKGQQNLFHSEHESSRPNMMFEYEGDY